MAIGADAWMVELRVSESSLSKPDTVVQSNESFGLGSYIMSSVSIDMVIQNHA